MEKFSMSPSYMVMFSYRPQPTVSYFYIFFCIVIRICKQIPWLNQQQQKSIEPTSDSYVNVRVSEEVSSTTIK